MTSQEMQDASQKKVKQMMDLMESLHLRVTAHQRVNQNGFIENIISWNDDEKYPQSPAAPVPVPTSDDEILNAANPPEEISAAPTGETSETAN